MTKKIIVTIGKLGEVEVEAKGVSGPSCKKFTDAVEKALGVKTNDRATAEMAKAEQKAKQSARY